MGSREWRQRGKGFRGCGIILVFVVSGLEGDDEGEQMGWGFLVQNGLGHGCQRLL